MDYSTEFQLGRAVPYVFRIFYGKIKFIFPHCGCHFHEKIWGIGEKQERESGGGGGGGGGSRKIKGKR